MVRRRKTWTEKMETPACHQVKRITKNLAGMKTGQVVLIATPKIVEQYICDIPAGGHVDMTKLRNDLAEKYEAEGTCPLTTGIFLRIIAEAANEAYENSTPLSEITPVWRVLDDNSPTLKKLSFDPAYMLMQRDLENNATKS